VDPPEPWATPIGLFSSSGLPLAATDAKKQSKSMCLKEMKK
jgi:hypothetical protein